MSKIKLKNSHLIHLYDKEKYYATIQCPNNKSILHAAENFNINLPYSCRAGSCSACAGKIISGTVDQSDQIFLNETQLKEGYILTCVSYPTSEVSIQTHKEDNLY